MSDDTRAPMVRYVNEDKSNIRTTLPESYPARIFAIIQDLDYPFEYTMFVPYNTDKMYINLNAGDFFDYATADCESINEEDMELFEATARELEQLEQEGLLEEEKDYPTLYLDQLFMCRKRKRRPLAARLTSEGYIPKKLVYLFEAVDNEV